MFCSVHVYAYILKVCIITDFDFYQTDKLYIFSDKISAGFQFIFSLVLKFPLLLSKFNVTVICFARNKVNNTPLTMKHVKWKKKLQSRCTKITLYHPRQMYVYLKYLTIQISQSVLSCRAIQKAWLTLHRVGLLFHFFLNLKLRYFQNALIWQNMFSVWIYGRLMIISHVVTSRSFDYVSHV
jgi:hypothetical protein